jgi:hypothetical protein
MVGAVAATLFLVGPAGVCGLLGWAYVEGGAACAMIAASVAWLVSYTERERGWLRAAAVLAGVAVTFKITSALFPAAMVALTFLAEIDPGRSAEAPARRWLGGAAVVARIAPLVVVPLLPWMGRAALVTGNPLYPLFARWIPSRDLTPDLSSKFDAFNRYMTWGNVFGRSWSLERREHVLLGVCLGIALLGVFAIVSLRTWMGRAAAAVCTVALLAQLSAAGIYIRYSIPLVSVLMLVLAAAFAGALARRQAPAILVALTLLAAVAQAKRTLAAGDSDLKGLVATALGIEDRRAYLLRHMGLYPLYEEVNRDLPKDSRVLLSCYCSGFFIDRTTYCADMIQTSLRVSSWDEFLSDLRRLGVTHVIAPSALATGGPSPRYDLSSTSSITREDQYRVMRPLLTEHARVRAIASDQGLYEIDRSLRGDDAH